MIDWSLKHFVYCRCTFIGRLVEIECSFEYTCVNFSFRSRQSLSMTVCSFHVKLAKVSSHVPFSRTVWNDVYKHTESGINEINKISNLQLQTWRM